MTKVCLAILQSLANHIDENKKNNGESYYKGAFQACKIWVHRLFIWGDRCFKMPTNQCDVHQPIYNVVFEKFINSNGEIKTTQFLIDAIIMMIEALESTNCNQKREGPDPHNTHTLPCGPWCPNLPD